MARRKAKQNMELLQQAFAVANNDLELYNLPTVNEKVHAIIIAADNVQDEICKAADSIKINAYQTVKETWPEFGIPKSVWLELVHMRRLQRHTTLTDDYIAKIMLTFEGAKNVTAFRSTLLQALQSNALDTVQVPTCDTEKQLQFEGTEQLPAEFITLLNDCADTRHEIDSKMFPKLRMYGDAFCFLTKEPYARFKQLLDLYHYRNGGWPKETTPPRIWSTIFRFIQSYDMLQQYGFDMAANWCRRMGLQTTRTLPSPTMFNFTVDGERFGQYFMAKLKDDTASKYPQYNFQPWHHLIAAKGKFFAYVWDTRHIDFVGNIADLQLEDLRTDYEDKLTDLQVDDDLRELALQCIPDVIAKTFDEPEEPAKPEEPEVLPMNIEQRKAALLAKHSNEAQQVIQDDAIGRYEALHANPEQGFDENYSVRWKTGDRCYSEILGDGYVSGADQETGELIVYFYKYDKEFRCWMWHLTKLESTKLEQDEN